MPTSEDELLQRLRATFRVEAQEHVQAISSGLVELERTEDAATETPNLSAKVTE